MKVKLGILVLLASVCVASSYYISAKYPAYFPEPVYDLNAATNAQISLGRALFYDPLLSSDTTISCASCHSPYNAFAHTDHDLSHGINDIIGTRNAPALFNLAWQKNLMWDGASNHLDVQALAPITHPGEMNETIANIIKKLNNSLIYPSLFQNAYGEKAVTSVGLLKALTAFQLTLISANAKYDQVKQGKDQFTGQELAGYSLFKATCNSCHTEPLFTNGNFKNNGLAVDTTLNDWGRWNITKQAEDSLKFKVPTLRNLSYTYPYMHDGRFTKLHQVLNHYTQEINHATTLAPQLKSGILLSSNQKADLIAFLLTLNDKEFVFNPENKFPKEILLPKKD